MISITWFKLSSQSRRLRKSMHLLPSMTSKHSRIIMKMSDSWRIGVNYSKESALQMNFMAFESIQLPADHFCHPMNIQRVLLSWGFYKIAIFSGPESGQRWVQNGRCSFKMVVVGLKRTMFGLSTRLRWPMSDRNGRCCTGIKVSDVGRKWPYGVTRVDFRPDTIPSFQIKKSRLIRTSLFYSDWHGIRLYRMAIKWMCKWEIWYELYNDIALTPDEVN